MPYGVLAFFFFFLVLGVAVLSSGVVGVSVMGCGVTPAVGDMVCGIAAGAVCMACGVPPGIGDMVWTVVAFTPVALKITILNMLLICSRPRLMHGCLQQYETELLSFVVYNQTK